MLVGHELEDEARERSFRHRPGAFVFVVCLRINAFDRRNVERARQEIDDRVEQRLHALVLEGRAGNDRDDLHRERAFAERRANLSS
jgi:plasmid stabilization system protein ParE